MKRQSSAKLGCQCIVIFSFTALNRLEGATLQGAVTGGIGQAFGSCPQQRDSLAQLFYPGQWRLVQSLLCLPHAHEIVAWTYELCLVEQFVSW